MPSTLRRVVQIFAWIAAVMAAVISADNLAPKAGKPGVVELGHGAKALLWREPMDSAPAAIW